MKGQIKLELLLRDINRTIILFEKRRSRHKKKAYRLKLFSIVGSAIVTILLGLKSIGDLDILADITLILSALITMFNGIEGFYNHRGLWVKDVKTLTSLRELKRDVEFYTAGELEENLSPEALAEFKNRLQRICSEDVRMWTHIKEDQILAEKSD
ncbi:DUF4231 domain-containing protein [Niallia sp. Krafla_26]|uniref:DUF4231 domain-containing protein n=1 Tax=Niallia sp. Krafla_26 TaxID=3064703 RepID=UPI003D1636C2